MDCKFAYLKPKIPYLLCRKEAEPDGFNKTELFHAVCPHQAHCPKENCHKNTAGWVNCLKLVQRAQEAAQQPPVEEAQQPEETPKAPQKSRRKPKSEE